MSRSWSTDAWSAASAYSRRVSPSLGARFAEWRLHSRAASLRGAKAHAPRRADSRCRRACTVGRGPCSATAALLCSSRFESTFAPGWLRRSGRRRGCPTAALGPAAPAAPRGVLAELGFHSASSSIYSAGAYRPAARTPVIAQIPKPFRACWSVALFRPSSCCSTLAGTCAGSSAGPTARSSCRSRPCRSACESQWACLPLGSSVSANAGIGTVHREGIDEGGVARARARGSAEGPCVVRKSG